MRGAAPPQRGHQVAAGFSTCAPVLDRIVAPVSAAHIEPEAWQPAPPVVAAMLPPPGPVVLQNARILDTVNGFCSDDRHTVVVVDGRILSCSYQQSGAAPARAAAALAADFEVVDCQGLVLMPGRGPWTWMPANW